MAAKLYLGAAATMPILSMLEKKGSVQEAMGKISDITIEGMLGDSVTNLLASPVQLQTQVYTTASSAS